MKDILTSYQILCNSMYGTGLTNILENTDPIPSLKPELDSEIKIIHRGWEKVMRNLMEDGRRLKRDREMHQIIKK